MINAPAPSPRRHSATALLGSLVLVPTLLVMAGCADPGAAAVQSVPSDDAASAQPSGETFDLTADQDRPASDVSPDAEALVPEDISADGRLSVAVSPFSAPLALYATDNTTPIGNEVDIAHALAQSLGLEVEVVPVAWADWPLGVELLGDLLAGTDQVRGEEHPARTLP